MSIEKFTFPYYIRNSKSEYTQLFNTVFNDEIINIPENTVSSRSLMKHLNLNTVYKQRVFHNVYMDFFKEKILKNL